MEVFNTHDEAVSYAKQNPGVVITRAENGNDYIVKAPRKKSECDSLMSESHVRDNISSVKKKIIDFFKKKEVDNSRSLLIDTKAELNYIVACILQTNVKEANSFTTKAGEALVSKLVGAGSAGGLLGLVSTFGTAGTGTAITSLSGAAATNATMAWIGSIIGGGMVAGTVLTGGLAVIVGFGTYTLMSSKAREYARLEKNEREIVDKCILLIRYTDELIEKLYFPNQQEMKSLLEESVCPLNKLLVNSEDDILSRLDTKNRMALNINAIPNFDELIKKYKKFMQEER